MSKSKIILNRCIFSFALITIFSIVVYGSMMVNDLVSASAQTNVVEAGTMPSLPPIQQLIKEYSPKTDPVNLLLVCGDQSSGNTDTIMLVNYNPKTCDINMISIPRDTSVSIDGRLRKINFAYPTGGIERVCKMVSQLLGVSIDYHFYIDTSIFRDVINILGGVRYYVPTDIKYTDRKQNLYINFSKGWHTLDGKGAEQLVRFRKPNKGRYTRELLQYYDGGDLKRIDAQQEFVKQVIKQKASVKYINKLNSILKIIFKKVKTNMTIQQATSLLYNAKELDYKKLKSYRLSGKSKTVDAWYYFYNDRLYSNATKKSYKAHKVINREFTSFGLYLKNNPLKSKQFKAKIDMYRKTGNIYGKK